MTADTDVKKTDTGDNATICPSDSDVNCVDTHVSYKIHHMDVKCADMSVTNSKYNCRRRGLAPLSQHASLAVLMVTVPRLSSP